MPRADIKKLKKLKVAIPSDVEDANKLGLLVAKKIQEFINMRKISAIQLEAIEALSFAILREAFQFKKNNVPNFAL